MLAIGNKKFRNLPEQVGYNTQEIEEIKKQLDGMVVEDHLVVLNASSGTLTDEEFNTLDAPLSFISYNDRLYIKRAEPGSQIIFDSCELLADEVGGAYYALGQWAVTITVSTKEYTIQKHQILNVYSKTQMDSFLADKLDKSDLLDKTYPVGAIYLSTVSTSPASLFGGTWEAIEGKFLLAAGGGYTAGNTGGEATHTLSVGEMPSHEHRVIVIPEGENTQYALGRNDYSQSGSNAPQFTWASDMGRGNIWAAATGGGQAHNNMPPYLVVYMWKRTA